MPWFRIDDSFYDHPKIFDAPDCALALWVRAGTWSARNLTDGLVPIGLPTRFCDDPERAVKELLDRGLWKRTRGGYRFHDWLEYQPSKEEASAGRDGMSSGGALGNHRRWHVGKGQKNASCRYCQAKQDRLPDRLPDQVPEGVPESGANPPARPDPKNLGGRSTTVTNDRAHEASKPPPDRCPEHIDHPNPPPCGGCGDARRTRETHDRARAAEASAAQSTAARERAIATRAAIDACHTCDHDGRVNGYTCRHDTRTPDVAARGAAAARAELARRGADQ